ncbi:MAG: hypothetical protein HC836_32800 [Richelia sp. RM2_1_2]|nr:hypothetical protein [Richelia sp. RM2_1_2]
MSKEIHGTRTREQIKISNEKRKITNLQKYGQISSIPKEQKEKIIEKMIREGRYADIAKKGKQSKKIKYGNENYNNAIQIKKSKASRTSLQEKESSEKRRRTCLELYGIENILMRDDIKHKIGQFNGLSKKYMLPSGAEIQVAGYEQLALDILFKTYNEDECISGVFFGENKRIGYNIPVIKYKDTKNRSRRYYPDIYLPNENKIIEVKSRWWYDGCGKEKYKSRLENNNKKRNATLKEGYDFEIWIMDNNGLKEIIK